MTPQLFRRGRMSLPNAAAPTSFSTSFPVAENPISSTLWQLGATDGLDWINPQSTVGKCFAGGLSGTGASNFDDTTANLKTSVYAATPNQFAQATVFKQSGYSPTGDHEVELRLRSAISANSATGYEILWGISGSTGQAYANLAVWNGPLGSFTTLWNSGLGGVNLAADGDLIYAQIVGTVIVIKFAGVTVQTYDTAGDAVKWSSGQPGLGFYALSGATLANYGFKDWSAGNL